MRGRRDREQGVGGDLSSQFRSVEALLGSKRADLTGRLQRMRFGQELTLELIGGEELRGCLRGCNGVKVVLVDGRSVPVARIREVRVDGPVREP